MKFLRPLAIAFSLYSRIPMPRVEWDGRSMRYALCFFPLVGAVTGGLLWLLLWLCSALGVGAGLTAALAVALPVGVNGGIHLDGFCDTADALSSHQTRERKLEILKDPHAGAFAVLSCAVYLLLQFGLWTEFSFSPRSAGVVAIGFVFSRSLSGFSVAAFPCAKNSGLAAAFSGAAQKNAVKACMAVFWLLCAAGMLACGGWEGAAALLAAALVFAYYGVMSSRQFGGITGDLAGYFLQICELAVLAAVVLVQLGKGMLG